MSGMINQMPRKIDISHKTIIFIALFVLGLWITYLILDLLLLIFVAVILTSALNPLVEFFQKLKIPKILAIIFTYLIMIAVVGAILAGLVPPLIEQSGNLIAALPPGVAQMFQLDRIDISTIQTDLTNVTGNVYGVAVAIFNNLITIILLLVLTFYLLLERDDLKSRGSSIFIGNEIRVKNLIAKVEEKLGAWFIGQMFLSVIIGVITYIGLLVLNIPYALPLALLAGVMEVVPVIGPIIAAIPAVIIAFTVAPILAAGVAGMYFVIQQLENHLIVPQVMKRAVGLNPLVVILAIAIGGRLLGIGGALLAVPIVVVLQILFQDILKGNISDNI